jgi:hypothetical protein
MNIRNFHNSFLPFVLLCVFICDPLWLILFLLPRRCTNAITKGRKGFFNNLYVNSVNLHYGQD